MRGGQARWAAYWDVFVEIAQSRVNVHVTVADPLEAYMGGNHILVL